MKKISEKKIGTPVEQLCKGYPQEFAQYLNYCRSLQFEDKPDYAYLRKLFRDLFIREGLKYDAMFDWTIIKCQADKTLASALNLTYNNGNNNMVTTTTTTSTPISMMTDKSDDDKAYPPSNVTSDSKKVNLSRTQNSSPKRESSDGEKRMVTNTQSTPSTTTTTASKSQTQPQPERKSSLTGRNGEGKLFKGSFNLKLRSSASKDEDKTKSSTSKSTTQSGSRSKGKEET